MVSSFSGLELNIGYLLYRLKATAKQKLLSLSLDTIVHVSQKRSYPRQLQGYFILKKWNMQDFLIHLNAKIQLASFSVCPERPGGGLWGREQAVLQ